MSAYTEKRHEEEYINYLEGEIKELEFSLMLRRRQLERAKERLAEAEQDIKWEAQNDR